MSTISKLIGLLPFHSGSTRIAATILILVVCAGLAAPQSVKKRRPAVTSRSASRSVVINAIRLDDATLYAIERQYQTRIPNGRYWYDSVCGAWGIAGGPTRGFGVPGLAVGGPLRADASRGRTGVFINGRELHELDVIALRRLGPVYRGRYWVDADGNGGFEGGPAIFNLVQLARAAAARSGNRSSRGRRGSALTTWDRTGVAVFAW